MKIQATLFAFGLCFVSVAEAQTRCPSFDAASATDRASLELQAAAFNTHRQNGQMVGDDPSFDLVHAALREASLHSRYLTALYQILPDLSQGRAKEWLVGVIIPGIGSDIGSALSLVDSFVPRIRNASVRVLLEKSVELRRSLGRDFERCQLP